MTARTARCLNLLGWFLFILSALFFAWSTYAAGDGIGFVASLLFLIACFVFMAPLVRSTIEEPAQ